MTHYHVTTPKFSNIWYGVCVYAFVYTFLPMSGQIPVMSSIVGCVVVFIVSGILILMEATVCWRVCRSFIYYYYYTHPFICPAMSIIVYIYVYFYKGYLHKIYLCYLTQSDFAFNKKKEAFYDVLLLFLFIYFNLEPPAIFITHLRLLGH